MILIFPISIFWLLTSSGSSGDKLLGQWKSSDATRTLEFMKNENHYYAVIRKAPESDLVGKKQVGNLLFNGKNYTGTIYIIKKNKSFPCTISFKNDNLIIIEVNAGFAKKSDQYSRISQ